MEPESEPNRCRRTDGRKWRCREIVVPNQKYCERHMHRGRGRSSRKRVERDSQSASEPDNSSSIASEYGDRKKRDNHQVKEGEERGLQNSDPKKINHQSEEKANHPKFISPGFGSSPKSVLCHSAGNVELSLDPKNPKNVSESIPERCRRTDGKKWQCSQYALPSQKYCHSHMHRGNKVLEGCSSSILPRSLENSINLNAIPKSPQHIDGNSASDATTNSRFSLAKSLINC